MPRFKEWLGHRTEEDGDAGRVVDILFDSPFLTSTDRSLAEAYNALSESHIASPLPRELHNALRELHSAFRQETHDPEMVAIVPLADSSHMWDTELHCGYAHAGYADDNAVDFCSTEDQVEASEKKVIVLDIRHTPADEAYLQLCDLASRAVSCGYTLKVQRFGD